MSDQILTSYRSLCKKKKKKKKERKKEKLKNYIGRNDNKFPIKVRDIHKRNSIGIKMFGYKDKKKYSIHVSIKCCEDKNIDLLMIGEVEKKHHILIKGFNTFTYDHNYIVGEFLLSLFPSI